MASALVTGICLGNVCEIWAQCILAGRWPVPSWHPTVVCSVSTARPAAGRVLCSEERAELVPTQACQWAGELHHLQQVSVLAASALKLLMHCSVSIE